MTTRRWSRGRCVPLGLLGRCAVLALLVACSSDPTGPGKGGEADATGPGASDSDIASATPEGLAIVAVAPQRGPVAGGEQVDVTGTGFGAKARVFFGAAEAEVSYRAGTTHLFAIAPAAVVPGPVDVRIHNDDGQVVQLPRAYTYLSEVTVESFAPELGAHTGGTALTVRGTGFSPGDRVLVGHVEAMASQVLDPTTIVALTPAWSSLGAADLAKVTVSVRHASGLSHAPGHFTYGRTPKVEFVDPGVVGVGGGPATLHGAGLGNATAAWANGVQVTLAEGTAGGARGATLPALETLSPDAQPGPADLLLASPFGASKLSPAFAYVDSQATSVALYGVVPASGTASGGSPVHLLAALPAGAQVQEVRFGAKTAAFKQTGMQLTADTPAHAAGAVDVEIVTDQGSAKKTAAYTFLAPLDVTKVVPDNGPTTGGTQVGLKGKGFSSLCTVRVGIYPAKIESVSADGKTLSFVTPPGAPGSADIVLTCGVVEHVVANGFAYTDGKIQINSVLPASGATGGGTTVQIYGSGFKKGMQVYFGGKPASAVNVVHSGKAEAKAPPHPAGPVTVDVVFGKNTDALIDGFVYFSPVSPQGGTWGEGVGGTLNVTVLNIYTLTPIVNAVVQVGQPGDANYPKYHGLTDTSGQVVFSGPDLAPPVTVSATKASFSASSIVSFDARNATVLLFPHVPPSSGGGGGGPALPLAELRGTVTDLDKYLVVPPTNCLKSSNLGDKTCDACESDADCAGVAAGGATFTCVDNGQAAGKRCLAVCTEKDVCTKGFACFAEPTAPGLKVCKPSLGIRKVLCATSLRDIEAENPLPAVNAPVGEGALPYPTAVVDEQTGQFVLSSRLDELAIQCIGGYISNETKAFVPTVMGVRRHVFPKPGEVIEGLDLKLDIPLKRTLPVRLDHPQKFFGSQGGTLRLGAWLNLGSDGYVRLHDVIQPGAGNAGSGVTDDVDLPYQPTTLPKELTDTQFVYYARAEFAGQLGVPPLTATLHDDVVAPGDANLRVRHADGTTSDTALGVDLDLSAVIAGADDQVLIAARHGRVYRGPASGPTLVYVPPVLDPYTPPLVVLAAAGTPTDATLVGELGLVRRVLGNKVTQEQGALDVTLHGVCHGPAGRVAVGAQGGVQIDPQDSAVGGWQKLDSGTGDTLRAVACTATGAVAVGDKGRVVEIQLLGTPSATSTVVGSAHLHAVVVDEAGELWLGGDAPSGGGPILRRRKPGGSWEEGWPVGTVTPKIPGLRAIVPLPGVGLLLVDREGGLRRLTAAGVADETPERLDLRPRAGAGLSDGSAVLVGQPGLWLGPFLTIPDILKPGQDGNSGAVPVEWAVAPGPTPSFTRVHLDGNGFPFWWMYVGPEITSLVLPDFNALEGIKVFPTNIPNLTYVARIDRVYVPGFSINGFATFDLEFGPWRSWATNARPFSIK